MAHDNQYSLSGNLTADPELRFTQSGVAVASFTVANTARTFNKDTNEWEDGDTIFMRCSVWRQLAENVAESLQKGHRVMVTGRLTQREYEKDGQKRIAIDLQVEEVAASLKMATVKITKTSGQNSGGYQQEPQRQSRQSNQRQSRGAGQSRSQYNTGGARYQDDEPPF